MQIYNYMMIIKYYSICLKYQVNINDQNNTQKMQNMVYTWSLLYLLNRPTFLSASSPSMSSSSCCEFEEPEKVGPCE